MKFSNVYSVLQHVGFFNVMDHPPSGLLGGLAFPWRDGFDFDVVSIYSNILNLMEISDSIGHHGYIY